MTDAASSEETALPLPGAMYFCPAGTTCWPQVAHTPSSPTVWPSAGLMTAPHTAQVSGSVQVAGPPEVWGNWGDSSMPQRRQVWGAAQVASGPGSWPSASVITLPHSVQISASVQVAGAADTCLWQPVSTMAKASSAADRQMIRFMGYFLSWCRLSITMHDYSKQDNFLQVRKCELFPRQPPRKICVALWKKMCYTDMTVNS